VPPVTGAQCKRTIKADVLAMAQPIMLNRLGAAIPDGKIFVLRGDTKQLANGQFQLRPDKRARPLVLRANVGDCLAITLTNVIPAAKFNAPQTKAAGAPNFPYTLPAGSTPEVSLHVQGMEWVVGSQDDGSFVGKNNSSLVDPGLGNSKTYKLFARQEGTFLLYTMGDTTSTGNQLTEGLFGAVNVQPANAEWYRSQVAQKDLKLATTGTTSDGHPIIKYDAVYPAGATYPDGTPIPANTPILSMLDTNLNIVHTDLTAMITGPKHGRFTQPEVDCDAGAAITPAGVDPLFCKNPASPDRRQPYREFTIIYHGGLTPVAAQAFPVFTDPAMQNMLVAGQDAFAINYGTGGIGAEVYANRIGVGPMGDCVDCKFEEFFLSAWSVGDPAMLVDRPANTNIKPPLPPSPAAPQIPPPPPLCTSAQLGDTNPPTAPDKNCVNSRQPTGSPRTGTVTFSNGSATVTGAGTSFKTELVVGDQLVLVSSPSTIRGTVKTITNNTQLVLQAKAAAGANGAYSLANPYQLAPLTKATIAYYPDDPSNVYHSYINDHLKFRILHGGRDVTHVHHQHAHQWLQSPNSDQGSYLDSQMISPGASYTLEMVYNGSGNRNKVVGDSIFHCHFYPHFAAGMWAMWRTHDVFESGTEIDKTGMPIKGARALPDGEIKAGTPIPAIVPLPTIAMAPLPSAVFIDQGQVVYGTPTGNPPTPDEKSGVNVKENPGFPFFIPGVAGARAPHPPLDFAPKPGGGFWDGGLPRHVVTGGTVSYESHDTLDWSKDLEKVTAIKLPEEGTHVEQVAMGYFGKRCYSTFMPDGTPGTCPSSNSTTPQSTLNTPPTGFVLNGLPRKILGSSNPAFQLGATPGAPFADPAIDDNGVAVGNLRRYKAAAIQLGVTFNKKGWHYPQQRILTLWEDAANTLNYVSPYSWGFDPNAPAKPNARQPEPLFFRGNTGDIIEYWHTNLVPNYYLVDDFQVRTPTDILGQHIHLVKFDVTSSDGAGNGFNYEDGTFAPEEVQELITAINKAGGIFENGAQTPLLDPSDPSYKVVNAPPKEIVDCALNPGNPRCQPCPHDWTPTSRPQCASWLGAQTTIQRWYIDPLVDDHDEDRTLRTVFTHDHFGPSTHQQAGLYAGLLVEPKGSTWTSNDGQAMATRDDGGPTSWQARIITAKSEDSYREFMVEFQDLQLAYWTSYPPIVTAPNPNPKIGWISTKNAINPPGSSTEARPSLISTGINITPTGTQSVNYSNEPIATRLGSSVAFPPPSKFSDLSYVFDNTIQPTVNPSVGPWDKPDPLTPLMRAYQNDNVQLRVLVGAHVFSHQFNLFGPRWFAEPSWENSGYRSAQAMGLSEHFEFRFKVPSSSAPNTPRKCPDGMSNVNCIDYLYSPSFDESGLANGLWGLFRSYDPTAKSDDPIVKTVVPLPNNPIAPGTNVTYATCPANAPQRTFNISAVTSQKALASQSPFPRSIVFNGRGDPNKVLANWQGIMYVRTEDLGPGGELNKGVPVEPLILRANAGDCINVNLINAIAPGSDVLKANFQLAPPLTNPPYPTKVSSVVGLRPQLLSYDAAKSTGINIGWNSQGQPDQVVPFGQTAKYQWYAGRIDRKGGSLSYTPVEFGSLNLFPSDTMFQNINGLFGSMIIEPQGSTWKCGELGALANCDPLLGAPPASYPPTTRASATVSSPDQTQFREFALMISDSIQVKPGIGGSAVNYRTEPWAFRYSDNPTLDFSCMLSNQLPQVLPSPATPMGDPKTPIFGANAWNQVRFRMTHPFGTGTSQVFSVNGHVWQRNPYNNSSAKIGSNKLSQWIGSRDNHGSSDHFDLLIDKAGGEGALGGDYLYSVFQFLQVSQGAWGIFRVNGKAQLPPAQGIPAACKAPTPKPGYYPAPAKPGKDGLMIRRPLN
jgi:hypothetical protein